MPEPSSAEHASYQAGEHDVSKVVAPHQQAGYDAVYEVIRAKPGAAWRNALIWSAVEAYRAAAEPEHERQVRAKVAEEIDRLKDAPPAVPYESLCVECGEDFQRNDRVTWRWRFAPQGLIHEECR